MTPRQLINRKHSPPSPDRCQFYPTSTQMDREAGENECAEICLNNSEAGSYIISLLGANFYPQG
jgi:hypothetical protein